MGVVCMCVGEVVLKIAHSREDIDIINLCPVWFYTSLWL